MSDVNMCMQGSKGLSLDVCGYADGAPLPGRERHAVINPANPDETVGHVAYTDGAGVAQAVAAANRVARDWVRVPFAERVERLRAGVAAVERVAPRDDLARLLTREQGKILRESEFEVSRVGGLVDLFGSLVERALASDVFEDTRGRRIRTYVPVGPVAAITPWNWPVSLSMGKIVPSLLAGNPTVLKPPPNTPLAISAIVTAIANELPSGVLNLVHGGAEVGAALVSEPGVRKVVFTGSTKSGAHVFRSCADGIRNMTLELGGNDAAIVLDDAILDEALARSILGSAMITAGQVCWAIKRIYVPRRLYAAFIDLLASELDKTVVGDGLAPDVTMGPLNNAAQLGIVRDLAEKARAGGATIRECGGRSPAARWDRGYFMLPTLVSDIDPKADLVVNEQFGPALPVVAYDSVDQAIEMANGTEYGLCGSVWTSDVERGFRVAEQVEAGQVFVNCHAGPALDYENAFGGIRQSGLGREMGVEGLREYLEPKLISNRVLR